ncbi:MAG TPA: hypothetical protein VE075_09275, partial [Thermoanaerobaculia bacterium]|nr:hypothetical protein [Thermoanaerobaculia bacterium]
KSGQYLAAPRAAAGGVRVRSWNIGPWETFNAVEPAGKQPLASGARVSLQAHGGRYLEIAAGSRDLEAGSQQAPSLAHPGALFVLRRVQGNGRVADGDAVTLETLAGDPLAVDFASGEVFAGSAAGGGKAAVFRLQLIAPPGQ